MRVTFLSIFSSKPSARTGEPAARVTAFFPRFFPPCLAAFAAIIALCQAAPDLEAFFFFGRPTLRFFAAIVSVPFSLKIQFQSQNSLLFTP
jgi:hypothetical protein